MNESRTSTSLKDSVTSKNWELVKVGEIASFSSGKSISVSSLKTQSPDTPIPVYGGNGIAGYTSRSLTDSRTIVVGRVGQKCGEVHLTKGPAWVTDNALYPHRIRQRVDLRFLALALEMAGLNEIRLRNDLPLVTQPILHAAQIALPAKLEEQRAIADALSDVDALIERLDALIAKKRAIKTATMQRLLTGKQRLPGFDGDWTTKRLGEIASKRNERVKPNPSNHEDFCIELEHVGQGTGTLTGSTRTTPTSSLKAVFYEDDILFAKLRSYLRKYWLADKQGVCSTEIWVLTTEDGEILPSYLYHHVTRDQFIEAASKAHGTHMPRADWKVVKDYEIELPPIDEQEAIATILSDMDAEIDALQARREKTQAIKQGMMQELLTGRTRLA